jgi:hypothetical protein
MWFEIWSLALREELGLTAFNNRVLRKTFGSQRREVREGGNIDGLHDLYSSPKAIQAIRSRRKRRIGAYGTYG